MSATPHRPDLEAFTGHAPRISRLGRDAIPGGTQILSLPVSQAPAFRELLGLSGGYLFLSNPACLCRVISLAESDAGLLVAVRGVAMAEAGELIAIRQGIEVVAVEPHPEAAAGPDDLECSQGLLNAVGEVFGQPLPATVASTLVDRVPLATLVRLVALGFLGDSGTATAADPENRVRTVIAALYDDGAASAAGPLAREPMPFSCN